MTTQANSETVRCNRCGSILGRANAIHYLAGFLCPFCAEDWRIDTEQERDFTCLHCGGRLYGSEDDWCPNCRFEVFGKLDSL